MKESKKCAKPPPPPRPNLKNKDFVKWSRGESCKKDDNIISTDWHERLQKTSPFTPVYDNAPLNMVYLLSGEYGRIWQKERDEWYSKVFVLSEKERDMDNRKKKIRKEIREAKKAAEINIKERKERKLKEAEVKAKVEAEKAEKLKAKIQKCAVKAKPKKKQTKPTPMPLPEQTQETCPKGYTAMELTMQCECPDHTKETKDLPKKEDKEVEANQKQKEESSTICNEYYQQLKDIQNAKSSEVLEEPKVENDETKECCEQMPAEKAQPD